MPDIENVTRPFVIRGTGAAQILTDSLNAAHAAGLTVSTAPDLGVICTSTAHPKWEPEAFAPAVSVLGAVLLARQPPIVDVDEALAYVFGHRPEFAEGIEDGVGGKPAPETADRLFCEGYFLGVQMRTLVATVPCALHLTRYPRGGKCPDCAAGVPVERPAETTERMQIDTPRSVIAELISSLTVAQVLEALADSIPGRGWSEDRTVDTVEDLRDLAEEYRQEEGS
jgi:hypothetical protein